MLYETLAQPIIFVWVMLAGFLSGTIFDLSKFFYTLCDKNKIVRFVLDFCATILCFLVLFLTILTISYGELRLWHILFFVASLLLERATIGKLVAKGIELCYNFCVKVLKKFFKIFQKKERGNDKKSC